MGAEDKEGIYVINVIGGTIRKLRDDARGATISPDSSHILFRSASGKEIWVMTADGEQAHAVIPAADPNRFYDATWSPDGKRFLYLRYVPESASFESFMESRDSNGGNPVPLVSDPDLRDYLWLPDNRIVYSRRETAPDPQNSNLWEIRIDPQTGQPRSKPRKLTDWSGFVFSILSATADGKQLTFINDHEQSDVYVAELDKNSTAIKQPLRLTLSDRIDWPGGWTLDSKKFLFSSDRNGRFDLYRQNVADRSPEAIGTAPEEKRTPQMSPDGASILYISWPNSTDNTAPASGRLMRIPVSGGAPEPIFEVKGYASSAPFGYVERNMGGYPSFQCPSRRGALCVLAERDREKKQVTFTSFDPAQGKKNSPVAVPAPVGTWALSPDGSRIATVTFDPKAASIKIIPLDGSASRDISIKGWVRLVSVGWTADGNGLFTIQNTSKGSAVLHVNMNGDAQVLYKSGWDIYLPIASPDGRSLSFSVVNSNANAWIIPKFPDR